MLQKSKRNFLKTSFNSLLKNLDKSFHVSRARLKVSGSLDEVARNHESGFKDQLPCQNVKNLNIKIILHLNRNFKLILRLNKNYKLANAFFTTLIFSLCNYVSCL